jgi:hypothetical protein
MAADSYANIRQYAISLYELMLSRNEGISKSRPETETMIVYVNKENLQRLMEVSGCEKIAFVIGQEKDKATIGLLCTDGQNRVLPAHIDGELDGEEVWDEVAMGQNLPTALP